jgi:hypothetical protein
LLDVKKTFAAAPQLRQEIREDALDGGSGGKEIGSTRSSLGQFASFRRISRI